jgi:Zn-dependent peptidase ImmA (M78 family)
MKWIPDTTTRFKWRPYYEQEELDTECERIVTQFLSQKHGEVHFPLSSDDLAVMIEKDTSDLDLYADLSREGRDVEGMTEFFANKKPAIRISQELSLDPNKNRHLRTTLAHEYGHVRFHGFLWEDKITSISGESILEKIPEQRRRYAQLRKSISSRSFSPSRRVLYSVLPLSSTSSFKCKQSNIVDAPFSDWMEWQASYAAGSFLMPLSRLRRAILAQFSEIGRSKYAVSDSNQAVEMIAYVSEFFDVSEAVAKARLEKLSFLQKTSLS